MTSLIDRYVFTALRRVPDKQRADIDRELRASIDDAVDARVAAGEPRTDAISATLTELGDPDRLADAYANRPQVLIGPDLYPVWRRLLLILLSIVLPIVVAVVTVLDVLEDPAIGPAIGTAVSTAIAVGVHMAFWTTAVFAVLERTGVTRTSVQRTWTLDDLPRYEPGWLTPGQLAANVAWPVLLIAALVLQQFTFTAEPVLDPANWSFWWPYLIAVLVLECGYAVWLYRRGAWTHTATLANAALAVLFTVPTVWLLADRRFFNPEYIAGLDSGSTVSLNWLTTICIVVVVAVALYDIAEVAVRAERARRGLPTKVPGTGEHSLGTN